MAEKTGSRATIAMVFVLWCPVVALMCRTSKLRDHVPQVDQLTLE